MNLWIEENKKKKNNRNRLVTRAMSIFQALCPRLIDNIRISNSDKRRNLFLKGQTVLSVKSLYVSSYCHSFFLCEKRTFGRIHLDSLTLVCAFYGPFNFVDS